MHTRTLALLALFSWLAPAAAAQRAAVAPVPSPREAAAERAAPQARASEIRIDFDARGDVREARAIEVADGALATSAAAGCSGGPGGNFDWIVRTGETFFFDTNATSIIGGPNGVPTAIQNSVGGRVEVRDFVIEEGGRVRVTGPNPFRLCASGTVTIRGELDLSGFDAKDVATLNTGYIPEVGGAGGPGGGRGGGSSEVTNGSTPRGGTGFAPDGATGGGQGGESGYAPRNLGKDARRPGGGGGGRFAADTASLAAGPGRPGEARSTGAVTGQSPAAGGVAGPGPFVDGDPGNDFWGLAVVRDGGPSTLVRGELAGLQGGYGGGGGGDAVPSSVFPQPNWTPGSDEKGGPGGGGGGAGHIRALGPIVFGYFGVIRCDGGEGATGENTLFLDHVGGTGGSGSGGMVVLESATRIDFTDGDPGSAPLVNRLQAEGGPLVKGPRNSSSTPIPTNVSYGGPGGPGLIQLHLPAEGQRPSDDPSAMLVLPTAAFELPDPLAGVASPRPVTLLPIPGDGGGAAVTRWAAVGDVPAGEPLAFHFAGVDADGAVLVAEGRVARGAPLVGPLPVGVGPNASARLVRGRASLELAAEALDELRARGGARYLDAPAMLRGALLRFEGPGVPGGARELDVAGARLVGGALRLLVAPAEGVAWLAGEDLTVSLHPRSFRLSTAGERDRLPEGATVRFAFQAAADDGSGHPDERHILVDWTSDASRLSGLAAPLWVRFRIEVERRGATYGPAGEPRPIALDFVRLDWSR